MPRGTGCMGKADKSTDAGRARTRGPKKAPWEPDTGLSARMTGKESCPRWCVLGRAGQKEDLSHGTRFAGSEIGILDTGAG